MIADGVRARRSFMSKACDIRDNLYFADPRQRVQAVQLYCCDGYGLMLWDFRSTMLRVVSKLGTYKLFFLIHW